MLSDDSPHDGITGNRKYGCAVHAVGPGQSEVRPLLQRNLPEKRVQTGSTHQQCWYVNTHLVLTSSGTQSCCTCLPEETQCVCRYSTGVTHLLWNAATVCHRSSTKQIVQIPSDLFHLLGDAVTRLSSWSRCTLHAAE